MRLIHFVINISQISHMLLYKCVFINWSMDQSFDWLTGSALISLSVCDYLYRAVVGEIDEDIEKRLDFSSIKAEPLNAIMHWHRLPDY